MLFLALSRRRRSQLLLPHGVDTGRMGEQSAFHLLSFKETAEGGSMEKGVYAEATLWRIMTIACFLLLLREELGEKLLFFPR